MNQANAAAHAEARKDMTDIMRMVEAHPHLCAQLTAEIIARMEEYAAPLPIFDFQSNRRAIASVLIMVWHVFLRIDWHPALLIADPGR